MSATSADTRVQPVLLPGLDGTGAQFGPLQDVMDDEHVVIAYEDDAPDAYDALSHWVRERLPQGRPFALVAESYSGPVAITLAADAPTDLRAVVLCNSFVRSPVSHLLRIVPWRIVLGRGPPDWAIRRWLLGGEASAPQCESVRSAVRRVDASVLARRLREILRVDVRNALAEVRIPILDLRGLDDRLVLLRAADDVRAYARNVRTATLDGPHLLLQARPRESWTAIRTFLIEAAM